MRMQAVKIIEWSFLLLSTVTLEQLLAKKKEQLSLSQATKDEFPKHG